MKERVKLLFHMALLIYLLQSSPPPLCPKGRDHDGKAIIKIINEAEKFVHIAVMDYFPTTQFTKPRM